MNWVLRAVSVLTMAFVFACGVCASAAAAEEKTAAPAAHALTAGDLEAFLDGFMPYARKRGDVAGTVVTVVKDGQVLFEKGYGFADMAAQKPVDPKTTLFRPGSISKLFTWTAVMQQVEAGKIDLDADINTYLDFKIPPAFGKPVTMRNLMTHTPGFEEAIKGLLAGRHSVRPLREVLSRWVPERIYPPGEVSAYSNYGAALAGYVVERISGEPFDSYIENHIFKPLAMHNASFRQPLPKDLSPFMSEGYKLASGKALGFEYVNMAPPGALSASGDAMTRFMLAYLNGGELDGVRILSAKSVALMWSNQHQIMPGLPPMGLGFYHMDQNGHEVVGHGGDTIYFHSELFLIPDAHVGVFFSRNSQGRDGGMLRGPLQDAFMNRYFPAPLAAALPTAKSAAADSRRVAGNYVVSRRSDSNFLRLQALLGEATVSAGKDGIVEVDAFKSLDGKPRKWREVAPLRWQEVNGPHVLLAREKDGKIVEIASDLVPAVMTFTRVKPWRDAAWSVPVLIACQMILLLTLIAWPVKSVLRWNYDRDFPLQGREAMLYRATRVVVLLDVLFFADWIAFALAGDSDLSLFSARGDWILWTLYALGALGIAGAVFPVLAFFEGLGSRVQPWWQKVGNFVVMLAALAMVWFAITERLVNWTVNY